MAQRLEKILIANRGEIALRVMRSCREMGIATVAVYSEADTSAPHVVMADEAYCIGAAPAKDSYLRGEAIIEAAQKSGAQAIHPGYGFLAENGDFAQAVTEAGVTFIGPPASAIRAMGSKTEARRLMMDAGLPVVPGDREGLDSPEAAFNSAERIGYPVLIKAAKGGGGKGMRIVRDKADLPAAIDAARREALSAFGDGEVYLEKYIEAPRHVEVQVLADSHGNCIHLYERECSIQRRHQKVIEEAPAPALRALPGLRDEMGRAAVLAAQACGYTNAGTVEFLFDPSHSTFYFLEMNTRLQVEHPVTEMVTGIDLVREQILISQGERLKIDQSKVRHRGHAIECRIYAEDTPAGFLPDAGTIRNIVEPSGPWVRLDSGVTEGSEVGVHYDPLIAKLIVWAPERDAALNRMHRALSEYHLTGLKTTIPFLKWVMQNDRFRSGDFSTHFVSDEYSTSAPPEPDRATRNAAIIAAVLHTRDRSAVSITKPAAEAPHLSNGKTNSWKAAGRLRELR